MSNDNQAQATNVTEPIAIVGVGCWLPGGVTTVEQLFAALHGGRDCVTEIPEDRWSMDEFYDADAVTAGKTYVRHGGFVNDIDKFDASFFGISGAEASRMDPQQRMVLQTVWHALENGGQSSEELFESNAGVFLAMMNTNDYSQLKGKFEGIEGIGAYDAMGDAISITAGRVAHFLGLEGPCFAVDTACSGSMVALHLARQSILAGDCDSAIVVGVSAILHPGISIAFSKVGLMSRSGRCRTFDASADGYVRGEGCVAVLVRRQSIAIERGDHILASIVSTAINQDGRTPALTAPNGRTQEKVIRMALARAGIRPDEIGYLEAHGTGTPVGDPIEMSALASVFGPERPSEDPLYLGSVKSNFGHLESAAALLGVVKGALSLDRETILPSLHFTRLNPSIDLGRAPLRVATTALSWPRGSRRRMAGVNSFGYSGTNAHTVLQEAPLPNLAERTGPRAAPAPERPSELVVISAKSAGSLEELADSWVAFLESDPTPPLGDIAFTAAAGRSHLSYRLATIGRSADEIAAKLRGWREGRLPKGLKAGQRTLKRRPKVAFMFTGQGAQYPGMGRELYEMEPRFKATIDRCAALMDEELGTPLREVLFGASSAELLGNTRYVQPAMFALEYALAELLRHFGVEPEIVIGHSVGEIAAACFAGVLSLEDASRFVVARGRLMGELPREGKMLAVQATAGEARSWIAGKDQDLSIAAVNGPEAVVISGRAAAIDAVAETIRESGHRAKELDVSHAFHSPLMDPILEELSRVAESLQIRPARIPVVSNITGDLLATGVNAAYWSSHVREAVLFHDGVGRIIDSGVTILVEVGPHPALTPAVATAFDVGKTRTVTTLLRDQQDFSNVLETLASLFASGVPLALERLFWSPAYRRVSLPLYPFRRDRHWLNIDALEAPPELPSELHPILGRAVGIAASRVTFETTLAATYPWSDHRVLGSTVFPATAYLEMAARGYAASRGEQWQPVVLKDVLFERPLVLAYGKPKTVKLTIERARGKEGEASFVVSAASNGNAETYCRGRIAPAGGEGERTPIDSALGGRETGLRVGPFYAELRKGGLEYGAHFSTVRELWTGRPGSGTAVGRVTAFAFDDVAEDHAYTNTVLLDGCLQMFGAALKTLDEMEIHGAFVPAKVHSVTLREPLPSKVWSQVSIRGGGDRKTAIAGIRVLSDDGKLLAAIEDLELRQMASLSLVREERRASGAGTATKREGPAHSSHKELAAQIEKLPRQERIGVLMKWLASEVKDTLGQAAEEIDFDNIEPSAAFLEIGLDSLLVTELQRRIQEKLDFRFQPMQGLDYQSIESLAEFILDEVLFQKPAGAPAASGDRLPLASPGDAAPREQADAR